jgi:23S rRNA pseudouridine1911/1915/1917 synthase
VNSSQILTAEIPESLAGMRFDQALSELFPDFSRSRLQRWIKNGSATVDDRPLTPSHRIWGGERVALRVAIEPITEIEGQDIPLSIVYEDEAILIINKPAGLVVHPAAGHWCGTLQNALLHHAPELVGIPRCGIVHRLDKDTSGLLVAAKTLQAHKSLVDQLHERSVQREYLALAQGTIIAGGTVDEPIGRHPVDRKRFTVRYEGKSAVTHYRVEERFLNHTLVRVKLETGRTHQIRVHLAHLHYPLVGDPVYGGRLRIPPGASEDLATALRNFQRQALHAKKLGLMHPKTGDYCEWQADLPQDFAELLNALNAN